MNLKGSALPADPKNRKKEKQKHVKSNLAKHSLILKVSGQMDITVEFSVFLHRLECGKIDFVDSFGKIFKNQGFLQ